MKKLLLGLLVAVIAYLLFWPVPITPQAWTAPPMPDTATGTYAVNQKLRAAEVIARGQGVGPEAIAFDPDGALYTGYVDGRLVRITDDGATVTPLASTGGRPLGLKWTPEGLVVADAQRGLLRLAPDTTVEVLSVESEGLPFRFVDDLDVAPDGRIYFSDASHRWGMKQLMHDFFEHAGTGRLLRYDPATGETETLLDGLYFANGIALGPDAEYVLVTETGRYQITRYWISGPRAGTSDIFLENLPGFPDNITWDAESQTFWLALYGPRDPVLDRTLPLPWLRKILFRLPEALHPAPALYAHLVGISPEGRVTHNAQASGEGAFAPITSVVRQGEWLYLGSLSYPGIGRIRLDAVR
jgi:sugar lactone lactonase YvrE